MCKPRPPVNQPNNIEWYTFMPTIQQILNWHHPVSHATVQHEKPPESLMPEITWENTYNVGWENPLVTHHMVETSLNDLPCHVAYNTKPAGYDTGLVDLKNVLE